MLSCQNTQITNLPELPSGLVWLKCNNCPLILQRGDNKSIQDYNLQWRAWREEKASKERTQRRTEAIKEDLMAEMWHPRRVEKMLALGGGEVF
jgi:hypothetical protein